MSNNIIRQMPKTCVNYYNTIVYKIVCKDKNIKDVYVGHTTNFTQRKYAHKINCINEKSDGYNLKVYDCIRKNGGWDNWEMVEICNQKCNTKIDALILEHHYYSLLNANLNSRPPFPNKNNKHNIANTPILNNLDNNITFNIDENNNELTNAIIDNKKYHCQTCNYYTDNLKDYKKHQATNKHLNAINNPPPITTVPVKKETYLCKKCNNKFRNRVTCWRHSKTCNQENEIKEKDEKVETTQVNGDVVSELIKKNEELQNVINKQSIALANSTERIIALANIINNLNEIINKNK